MYDLSIEICLIFLLIFSPLAYGAVQSWAIAVFEITSALILLFWISKNLVNRKLEYISNPINGFFFLFLIYVFIQLLFSRVSLPAALSQLPKSTYGWATKTELLKIISYAIIFFVTLNTIKTERQIMRIISTIIIMGFIMSVFWIMRYFKEFASVAPRGIRNYDHFAAYLGMIIPLNLGLLFTIGHKLNKNHIAIRNYYSTYYFQQILLLFIVAITSGALFISKSRGGMFSFAAAFTVILILTAVRKSIKRKIWIALTALFFILLNVVWLGASRIVERILSIKVEIVSAYIGGRVPIWRGTAHMLKDYLLFGSGFGTFNYIFPKYQPRELIIETYSHAHSDILELASDTGMVGFALSLFFGLWSLTWLLKQFFRRRNPWVLGMSVCIFGSLASIFMHSFIDFSLRIPANGILLMVIAALVIIILHYKEESLLSASSRNYSIKPLVCYSLYPITLMFIASFIFLSVAPFIAEFYFQKSESVKIKSMDSGIGFLKHSIKLDPLNALYYYDLGKIYFKKAVEIKDREVQADYVNSSIGYMKHSIELNPTNSKYHQSLAWSYGYLFKLFNHTEKEALYKNYADKEFRTAISLEPNYAYRYRAYAIWLLGNLSNEDIKAGMANYKKAVELEPKLMQEYNEKFAEYKKFLEDRQK